MRTASVLLFASTLLVVLSPLRGEEADLEVRSTADLEALLSRVRRVLDTRRPAESGRGGPLQLAGGSRLLPALPTVNFVHKSTYASFDPDVSASFAVSMLGADYTNQNTHLCGSTRTARWTRGDSNAGHSFHMHFVRNPNKAPFARPMNASNLARAIEQLRGKTFPHDTFDQLMDTHVGLVVDSLDAFVRLWRRSNVTFLCRTWCCAPGMPQYPRCPAYSMNRTEGCEVGCYVEMPATGMVVEVQCGIDSYSESLSCLTEAQPETFDLCSKH